MNVTATTTAAKLRSGYDLPVFGLSNNEFVEFHATALACMGVSLLSASAVCVASFKKRSFKTFFEWTKGERFVIYLAVCDGLFNISHSFDHSHYLITKQHVEPPWLCKMYSFILTEFITAQSLLVQVIAASAFILMVFKKQVSFGRRDWKLLLYTFGVPFVGAVISTLTDQYGPSGAFCYFDAVTGYVGGIIFTTALTSFVIVSNTILYIFTWYRIHMDIRKIKQTLGESSSAVRSSASAAKTMLLFVAAFFIQWWALAVYGLWVVLDPTTPPPLFFFKLVTSFSNLGGVINGIVYIIIRYKTAKASKSSTRRKTVSKPVTSVSQSVDNPAFSQI